MTTKEEAFVTHKSENFIKPNHKTKESNNPYFLTPWDLSFLSSTYIQNGLLYIKPSNFSTGNFLEKLKESLSLTLDKYYPLAGQLATQVDDNRHECYIFVDNNKGNGVRFGYGTLNMTISDVLSPTYVPSVVHSFFDHNDDVNYDGHTRPLMSVQVTELSDGVFVGVSMNHVVADGMSFWNFWNLWSEIYEAKEGHKLPVLNNRYRNGYTGIGIPLPFINPNEFVTRYKAPYLKERFFHFTPKSLAAIKARANEEGKTNKISTFQALTALVWKSIARANPKPRDMLSHCGLAISNRQRVNPPLPETYFGNSMNLTNASTTISELLGQDWGRAAILVHECIARHTNNVVCDYLKEWARCPSVYQLDTVSSFYTVLMINSPRFKMYENEFGLGKPVAVRSGRGMNKFPGVVIAYPGYEGGGSVDLEICLVPNAMKALESDQQFMSFTTK